MKKTDSVAEMRSPAFWGLISLALPIAAAVLGFLLLASVGKGVGGDMIGAGVAMLAIAALGVAAIGGLVAACVAIKKKERWIMCAVLGLVLNLPLALYGVSILRRLF